MHQRSANSCSALAASCICRPEQSAAQCWQAYQCMGDAELDHMVIAEAVVDGYGVVLDVWLLICRVVKLQGQGMIVSGQGVGA